MMKPRLNKSNQSLFQSKFITIQRFNESISKKLYQSKSTLKAAEEQLEKVKEQRKLFRTTTFDDHLQQFKHIPEVARLKTTNEFQRFLAKLQRSIKNIQHNINQKNAENQALKSEIDYLRKQKLVHKHEADELMLEIKRLEDQQSTLSRQAQQKKSKFQLLKTQNTKRRLQKNQMNKIISNQYYKIKDQLSCEKRKMMKMNKEEPIPESLFITHAPVQSHQIRHSNQFQHDQKIKLEQQHQKLQIIFKETKSDSIDEIINKMKLQEDQTVKLYNQILFLNKELQQLKLTQQQLSSQIQQINRQREEHILLNKNIRCKALQNKLKELQFEKQNFQKNLNREHDQIREAISSIAQFFDQIHVPIRYLNNLPPGFKGQDITQHNLRQVLQAIELTSNDIFNNYEQFNQICFYQGKKDNQLISTAQFDSILASFLPQKQEKQKTDHKKAEKPIEEKLQVENFYELASQTILNKRKAEVSKRKKK